MVKSSEFLSQTIINYLGLEQCAAFSALTDIFPDERLDDGVLWVQYDENDNISSVTAVGDSKTVLFTGEKTDFEELSFILGDKVTSPDKLPFAVVDKKYLLNIESDFDITEKGESTEDFAKIKSLEASDFTKALTSVAPKIYRAMKKRCCGAALRENGEIISGGFISFCDDFAVITDVFTKEEHRGKGFGTALVKKLLRLSKPKNVYLLCEEKNLDFYKNIGFRIVNTVYEYRRERS